MVPFSAGYHHSAVKNACPDFFVQITALFWNDSGSRYSAVVVVWQGSSPLVLRDHDCTGTRLSRSHNLAGGITRRYSRYLVRLVCGAKAVAACISLA